jgi:putative ABC transport system ATP-binding protein
MTLSPVGLATRDLLAALTALADTLGTDLNVDNIVDSLAGQQLNLDTAEDAQTLQRALTGCDAPLAWVEQRLCDAGRRQPCLLIANGASTAIVVEKYRLGFHEVKLIHGGRTERRRLRTAALARLLDRPPSSSIVSLVASSRLPLEPLNESGHSPWKRARVLLGLERADIRLTVVYGIAIGLLSVVTPIAVQALVNTIALGAVLDPLVVLTVLVTIVLIFAGVMRLLHAHVVEAIQARMFIRAAADITRRLFAASPSTLERTSPVELAARFLEVPVLQKAIAVVLVDGIDLLLRLVVGTVLLAIYHPTLLLFSLATLLTLTSVVIGFGRGAVATAINESRAKYDTIRWLDQTVRLASVVRTEDGRRRALDRADHLSRRYRDARRAHFSKLARTLAGGVGIQVVGSAALLGLGGALVVKGQLTLGQLVAAELVFGSIAMALVKLHKQLEAVYDIVASSKKFSALVDIPMERRGGERLPGQGGLAISISHATIGHGDVSLIRGATLSIGPGEHLAIVAPPGMGKTTFAEALASGHPLTSGQLLYDGRDVRYLSLQALRSQIAMVRGVDLAADTIDANLRYARPDAEIRNLEQVLEAVELDNVVSQLPDGLATMLTTTGRPLSQTSAQRLVLARALLARPRLIVIDGGLDNLGLDPEAKERVLNKLFRQRDTTLVVISNDPDVQRRCERVVHIAGEQLMEVGS